MNTTIALGLGFATEGNTVKVNPANPNGRTYANTATLTATINRLVPSGLTVDRFNPIKHGEPGCIALAPNEYAGDLINILTEAGYTVRIVPAYTDGCVRVGVLGEIEPV